MARPFLLLCTLLLASTASAQVSRTPSGTENTVIQTSAQGVVASVPDLAVLTLEIVRDGETAEALRPEVNGVIEEVLEAARGLGIEDRDVSAADVIVEPRYDRQAGINEVIGVRVQRPVRVVLRDIERVPDLIDAALAAGVNTVSGTTRMLSDPKPAQDEALTRATQAAMDRARVIARSLGLEVGRVLSVNANVNEPFYGRGEIVVTASRIGGPTSDSFQEGQISTVANANLTVELLAPGTARP